MSDNIPIALSGKLKLKGMFIVMKKFITLLLAVVLTVSALFGCGVKEKIQPDTQTENETVSGENDTETETEKNK